MLSVLDLTFIKENLPLIITLIIAQYTLMAVALVHVIRHNNFRVGNKVIWILVVILVNLIGPILYFMIGRSDD